MSKEIWLVGGPNGAGKTTWVSRARQVQEGVLYLSAEKGQELIVESTLSGRGMARFLELARDEGYRIVIVFMFLHRADLCVRRVLARVRRGGHNVPEADILRRYGRSKRNFWTLYRPLADEWHLYFNGGDTFEMVASGDAETMIVHNEARLSLFKDPRS